MAYYNNKKVLAVVKTDQAQFPTYEGSYTITANGTYPTAYKAFVDNLVVNVPTEGVFEKCFSRMTGTSWQDLFHVYDTNSVFRKLTYEDLLGLDLSRSSTITNMAYMFYDCVSLVAIPLFDTSHVNNMSYMFRGCTQLISIPAFNVSECTNLDGIFNNCANLEEIHATGMKVNFGISASTKFTRTALVEILNNLAVVTTTRRLTMGNTNLAKLTAEDRAIATNKGWTLA